MTVLHLSDEELLRRTLKGDEAAFTALYRRRQGGVYRFALQMSGSASVAEDVTQEVFLTLMREGRKFQPGRGSLAAWLCGIARNHVLRHLERRQRDLPIEPESELAAGDLLAELTRNQQVESLREAVLALPAHYREAVVLCDLHGMSYADAAQSIGCAEGTIRSRLHRGRALLMEKMRCFA